MKKVFGDLHTEINNVMVRESTVKYWAAIGYEDEVPYLKIYVEKSNTLFSAVPKDTIAVKIFLVFKEEDHWIVRKNPIIIGKVKVDCLIFNEGFPESNACYFPASIRSFKRRPDHIKFLIRQREGVLRKVTGERIRFKFKSIR